MGLGAPQTPLRGKLTLDWELPGRLKGQDVRTYIEQNVIFTLSGGLVLAGKCEDQAFKLFGSTGNRVLNAVVCALDHDGIYSMPRSQAFLLVTRLILEIQMMRR